MITKKQIDHYWYYYKWHAFACLFVIIILINIFYSCATTVNPDLVVTYIGIMPLESENMKAFEQEYAKYVIDANGDKKQVISMREIGFSPSGVINDPEMESAINMRLTVELAAGDTTLYLFGPDMLEYLQSQEVLQPLNSIGIEGDYVKLNGKPVLKVLKLLGEDYMAAVRIQPTSQNDQQKKQYENAFNVLKEIK